MLIEQFIEESLVQIKRGVKRFNDGDDNHSAEMPEWVDFDINVIDIGLEGQPILVMDDPKYSKESHNISFTVNTLNYRGTKSLYKK